MKNLDEICDRIMSYLLKNPDAGGSLEDISNWWLDSERVDQAVDQVGAAVTELLKRGFIKEIQSKNGVSIFKATRIDNDKV